MFFKVLAVTFLKSSKVILIILFIFQPEDPNGQLDYRYDEFGFKVEEEGTF